LVDNCSNSGSISTQNAGGICGGAFCFNGVGSVTNCTNSGSISGSSAGGICGALAGVNSGNASVTNCTNSGSINGSAAGGICGSQSGVSSGNASVTNCTNSGIISGGNAGGICGAYAGYSSGNASVTNCSNSGSISGYGAGGILAAYAGYSSGNASVTNCTNSGSISGIYAGGICGASSGESLGNVSVTNCSNSGIISGQYAGGIYGAYAGYNYGKASVTNCSNSGSISADFAGGICGAFPGQIYANVSVANCTNSGSISANRAGGIVGVDSGYSYGNVSISNCSNRGAITGEYSGGITGDKFGYDASYCSITNCYSIGNISGNNSGGICGAEIGYINNVSHNPIIVISNCYTMGRINTTCGGILGGTEGSTYTKIPNVTLSNCYTYGSVTDASSGLVADGLQIKDAGVSTSNCYIANGSWSDTSANELLLGTSDASFNPGTTWTDISSNATNVPYVLSSFNQEIYDPSVVTISDANYTSSSGLFQSDYRYIIINGNATNLSINSNNGVLSYSNVNSGSITNIFATKYDPSNNNYPYQYSINKFTLNYLLPPTSNICFLGNTPVKVDQGTFAISQLKEGIHSIEGKLIKRITKTKTNDKHLICIEKHALDINVPSQKTIITANHKIMYKGKMVKSKDLIGLVDNVYKTKYHGETLYNVLLETHETMSVNNMICETLSPENTIVQLYDILDKIPSEYHADIIVQFNNQIANKKLLKNY
jgi:hypothetical protein